MNIWKLLIGIDCSIMLIASTYGIIDVYFSSTHGIQSSFTPLILIASISIGATGFVWAKSELKQFIEKLLRIKTNQKGD